MQLQSPQIQSHNPNQHQLIDSHSMVLQLRQIVQSLQEVIIQLKQEIAQLKQMQGNSIQFASSNIPTNVQQSQVLHP